MSKAIGWGQRVDWHRGIH